MQKKYNFLQIESNTVPSSILFQISETNNIVLSLILFYCIKKQKDWTTSYSNLMTVLSLEIQLHIYDSDINIYIQKMYQNVTLFG